MAGQIAGDHALGRAYTQAVLQPRLDAIRHVLTVGVDRGELRSDLDVRMATAGIVGPMLLLAITRQFADLRDHAAERLADQALAGMRG